MDVTPGCGAVTDRFRPTQEDLEFEANAFAEEFPFPERPAVANAQPASDDKPQVNVLSVAELARTVRGGVDAAFPRSVLVRGEVANARPASSGHLYFTLKDEDEDAIVDIVVYKQSLTQRARKLVCDGARIRVRGKPSYWVPKGKLQFVGDRVDDEGKGALLEALEKLKAKLAAEGLFSPERKRPLPSNPRVIGVVTSATGAVIHDIARVAARRGGAHVLLASAKVQGADAAASMVRALKLVSRVGGVDVVILGRGGGSSDDLLSFNDEALVRAVASCRVPVIAAVGHDVDIPLVDFAADARAATPSQAAEMVVPDRRAQRAILEKQQAHLIRSMRMRIAEQRHALLQCERKLADPRLVIASLQQKKDELDTGLSRATSELLRKPRERAFDLSRRLAQEHPRTALARVQSRLARQIQQLSATIQRRVDRDHSQFSHTIARLDAMSPLKVLGRGYSITQGKNGRAIRDAREVTKGDAISIRVHSGKLHAIVDRVELADNVDEEE